MSNAGLMPCEPHGNPESNKYRGRYGQGRGMMVTLAALLLLSAAYCLAGDNPSPAGQLPGIDDFTPMETVPQMIKKTNPVYPKAEEENGVEGVVWVKALVGKTGAVLGAVVFKSSGNEALDASAIKAAVNNRFKPGIQNGKPVAAWISYKVAFAIPDEKKSE